MDEQPATIGTEQRDAMLRIFAQLIRDLSEKPLPSPVVRDPKRFAYPRTPEVLAVIRAEEAARAEALQRASTIEETILAAAEAARQQVLGPLPPKWTPDVGEGRERTSSSGPLHWRPPVRDFRRKPPGSAQTPK